MVDRVALMDWRTPANMVDRKEQVVRVEKLQELEVEEQERRQRRAPNQRQGRPESRQFGANSNRRRSRVLGWRRTRLTTVAGIARILFHFLAHYDRCAV